MAQALSSTWKPLKNSLSHEMIGLGESELARSYPIVGAAEAEV